MKQMMCIAVSLLLAGHLAGCSQSLNSATGFLDGPALPALDPDTPSLVDDAPSVRSLDRRDWPAVTIAVPTRQVEHYPAWIRSRNWLLDTAELGSYPTAIGALEVEHQPSVIAGDAAVELVALPAGYIMNAVRSSAAGGPFAIDRSPRPDGFFERRPGPQPDYAGRWIADGQPQP